jgi:hypothetical protein
MVAASRPANPVIVAGSREPGGDLAVFYPDRAISVGILQNVISLLTIADRRAYAQHNMERVRYEVAQQATERAAMVAEAWYRYRGALRLVELHERSLNATRTAVDVLKLEVANGQEGIAVVPPNEIALLNAQSRLDRARLAAGDERTRLANLLGIAGWRDDWQIAGDLPPLPATDPDPAVIEAVSTCWPGRRTSICACATSPRSAASAGSRSWRSACSGTRSWVARPSPAPPSPPSCRYSTSARLPCCRPMRSCAVP